MPRKNRLIDGLIGLPWWMSLAIAAVVFLCATRLVPALVPAMADQLAVMGWIFAVPFFLAAVASGMQQWLRSRLLDQQRGLAAIRALTGPEFVSRVGEAFRRQGYSVAEQGGAAPDGGFDLVLEKAGARVLVRCKHWQAQQIGVELVRELHDVMTAEGASEGILVTCGEYTGDARRFADGKPMRLVNGEALLEILKSASRS